MEREVKGIFIPIEIWKAKDLSWTEKVVLMEIDSFTSRGADCFFSNKYIAEMMDIKEDTASKIVNSLIRKGYVRQTRFDGRNRYLESCIKILCRDEQKAEAESEKNPTLDMKKVIDNKIINKPKNKPTTTTPSFVPPTVQEVAEYSRTRGYVDPVGFADYFVETNNNLGWKKKNGTPITNWKNCVVIWEKYHKDEVFPKRRPVTAGRTVSTLSPIYR